MNTPIKGTITLEKLDPADLLDAVGTIPKPYRNIGVCLEPPGAKSPEDLLKWAESEITAARDATNVADLERQADAAVMHARRALDCLVDWYLKGFGLSACKEAPTNGWEKSIRLRERGILDALTQRVLARAIDDRNKIEHEYSRVDLERAEDVVEMIRHVCRYIPQVRPADTAPCLIGAGCGYGFEWNDAKGTKATFTGWREPKSAQLLLVTFVAEPWLGIVVPSSDSKAHIRHAYMKDVPAEAMDQMWSHFGTPRADTSYGWQSWTLLLAEMGLP